MQSGSSVGDLGQKQIGSSEAIIKKSFLWPEKKNLVYNAAFGLNFRGPESINLDLGGMLGFSL